MSYTFKEEKPIGEIVGMKVGNLRPLFDEWRKQNPKVPISVLLRKGAKMALAPYATKKNRYLVEMN